ncbi:M2 family metallopeptidase, partial [bacterium]|nr:M2 family metallopeptidase [bacterium]
MNEDLLAEIAMLEERLRPLQRGASLAWWGMSTEGGQAYQEVAQVLGEAAKGLFADKERFSRLEAWHARREEIADPETRRILEHLYQEALAGQRTPEEIRRLLSLEIGLEADYTAHRGVVQGEEKSDNDLKEILETSTDNRLRQEAWEASKQVGEKVVERVLDVVRLRNTTARRLGRRDHYALALETQEVDEGFLFALLDSLDDLTRAPFLAHK